MALGGRLAWLALLLLPLLSVHEGCSGLEFRNFTLASSPGWSVSTVVSVTGWREQSAVLPCTFTYPGQAYREDITVIWFKDAPDQPQNTFFECSFPNSTQGGRTLAQCLTGNSCCRLVGDPRQNNISLQIRSLELAQNRKYFCRVELNQRDGAELTSQYDTQLSVNAPATILNLRVIGNDTVVCVAEGNPNPNISWHSSNGGHFSDSLDSGGELTGPYTRRSTITVKRNGTFTCVAQNEYDSVKAELQFADQTPEQKFPLLAVVLPMLTLLLLGLLLSLALFCWKRKGSSFKILSRRKASGIAIFTTEEVKEAEPVPAMLVQLIRPEEAGHRDRMSVCRNTTCRR